MTRTVDIHVWWEKWIFVGVFMSSGLNRYWGPRNKGHKVKWQGGKTT